MNIAENIKVIRTTIPAHVTLIAVSKTVDEPRLREAITYGQRVFGENYVQEAKAKWPALKAEFPDIKLNLIGHLQSNKADDAVNAYETVISGTKSADEKSRSFYNKGVVLQNNKKLPECIEAYKNALKLTPDDEDARQNLQKAMQQLKQQQQQEKQDKQHKKPKEDQQKEKQKPKKENKNEQPKPQPSKLTKQDAEEKLKALLQQEKNLQNKLKKVNAASPDKPEKDW